jgi:hypothetical protein
MLSRKLIGFVFAGLVAINAEAADVVVRIAPPHPIVERHGPPPGRGYLWVPGYYNWNGRSYVWVPGTWQLPPRPHAHWTPHRWVRRDHGWVLVPGHWR